MYTGKYIANNVTITMSDFSNITLLAPMLISFALLIVTLITTRSHGSLPASAPYDTDQYRITHHLHPIMRTHRHGFDAETIVRQNLLLTRALEQHRTQHRVLQQRLAHHIQEQRTHSRDLHRQIWRVEDNLLAMQFRLSERVLQLLEQGRAHAQNLHQQVLDVQADIERVREGVQGGAGVERRVAWLEDAMTDLRESVVELERGREQDERSDSSQYLRRSEASRGPPPSRSPPPPGDERGVWMRGGAGEEQKQIDTDAHEDFTPEITWGPVAETVNLGVEHSFPPGLWKCNNHRHCAYACQCTPPNGHHIADPTSSKDPNLQGSGYSEQPRKTFEMKGEGEGWSSSNDSNETNAEVPPSIPPLTQIRSKNQPLLTKEHSASHTLSSEPVYLLPNARLSNYPLSAFTRPHMHPGWQCPPGGYTLERDGRGKLRPLGLDELKKTIDEAYEGTKDWGEVVREDEAGWVKNGMGDWMARER